MEAETTNPEPQEEAFKAPQSQDELNAIIESRLARERNKFSDYDDLKQQVSTFTEKEQEAAQALSEATGRLTEYETKINDLQHSLLVRDVSMEKSVPVHLLSGSTKEELEASADALLEFRGEAKAGPASSAFENANRSSVATNSSAQFASVVEGLFNR